MMDNDIEKSIIEYIAVNDYDFRFQLTDLFF